MSFDLKLSNGDLVLTASGQPEAVTGNDKIRQDILKILLTEEGDNSYHQSYGSSVGSLNVGENFGQSFTERSMEGSVSNAINKLITLQKFQSRTQFLNPAEVIVSIRNIQIYRDELDPRMWSIFVSVITQELEEVGQSVTLRLI
jgi:hypothetical protein